MTTMSVLVAPWYLTQNTKEASKLNSIVAKSMMINVEFELTIHSIIKIRSKLLWAVPDNICNQLL